jgi:hypothetical protein
MNHLSRILFPAAALIVLSCAQASAADAIELKQRWIVGKKYYQTVQTTQTSTIAIAGQTIEQSAATTMEISQTVQPGEAGKGKRLTIRYDRVAMDMSTAGQKMGFDSAKPGEGNDALGMGKSLGSITGKELYVVINDKDEVVSVENFDEFTKGFQPGAPGMEIGKMFSKESITQMVKGSALQTMPGHLVKPGDSWPYSTEVDLPQIGKVGVKGTYTLKGVGDHEGVQCAEIQTEGAISLDFNGGAAGSPGAADASGGSPLAKLGLKVEGGTLKGTIWFDPKLGHTRDAQLDQEMTMTMKNPTDPAATLTIPVKQKISAKLTKVEDVK